MLCFLVVKQEVLPERAGFNYRSTINEEGQDSLEVEALFVVLLVIKADFAELICPA